MKRYQTDGIHEFVALHGFEYAVEVVAKSLKIDKNKAKRRIQIAIKKSRNEI